MAGKFSIEAIFKGNDQISKVIASIEGRVGKFSGGVGSGLKEIEKINGKILGGLGEIAKKAAVAGAVVGAIGFAGLSQVVHTGAEFEQTITDVGAVMGKTRGQIGDLEKAALSLGVSTQFSSTEVAQGMEMMARKGFDAEEVLAGIPGVLNAVAASGQDMAEVATVVGTAIRGFGMQAGEAGRIANVLTFVSEKTGARMTDLGEALAIAAPNAKLLGVSIEDTATAVGLLQKIGLPASVAGSSVSVMLSKMAKPSKEAAQEMTNLGIKFQDAKGNMLPFRDVLGQFVKASASAGGNMRQMAFFQELVGNRGEKAALGLRDMADSGDWDKLAKGIETVGDYAGKVAAMRMDTTMGSWKLLTSTIDVLEIKLFGLQSGPLRQVIDKTNAWVQANQDLIVTDVQKFITGIGDALPKIVIWGERIGKMTAVIGGFMLAVKIATGAMALFNAVADANPWVLLTYALVLLTAAVVAFWPEIKKHELAFRQAGVAIVELLGVVGALATAYGVFLIVTNLSTIATIAYIARVLVARSAMAAWAFITNFQAIKTGILTGIQWLQTAAVGAYNTVLALGQVAMALFSTETVTMTGVMTAALGPVLALVAALGALYLAKKMNDDLKNNTGGLGIFDIAGGMIKKGTLDPFKVVDEHQNEQARAAAKARGAAPPAAPTPGAPAVPGVPVIPGLPPAQDPQAMIAALLAQAGKTGATSANGQAPAQSAKDTGEALAAALAPKLTEALKQGKGEITVTVKGNGDASIDKQPDSGFTMNLAPSGSF